MSLSPQLKEFLSRQYILDMIDNNQWNKIYKGYRFWTRGRTFDPMTVKCSDGDIER